jgi:phage recombination protein Bet
MTEALMTAPANATPVVYPKEQLELVRRTVAKDATNDELALFLYDCSRRGVHPLDKLLHFTKRGGKYTPVTSIDFMRSQAAASGEMAGSDDPVFEEDEPHPLAATVTVYRITLGQRYAYTATARWSEYCPDNAPMWKRMPHTMLGKCAEALALRKAFPQQLAGLYSREEMDQADGPKAGYVVEAQRLGTTPTTPPGGNGKGPDVPADSLSSDDPEARDKQSKPGEHAVASAASFSESGLPQGTVLIERVEMTPTKNQNVKKYLITDSNGETYSTIKEQLGALCEQLAQEQLPVRIGPEDVKETKWGLDLLAVHRVERVIQLRDEDHGAPLDAGSIPF